MSEITTLSVLVLLGTGLFMTVATAEPLREATSLAPALSDEEAWKRLPPTEKGGGQPLPIWARMLAGPLPRTTAAMLQVDFAHRTSSPLDPRLRARMRWVAAHENKCAYSEAYAAEDARRAGLSTDALEALRRGDESSLPAAEKAALQFARKMTRDSASVSDAEFAFLVKEFGERKTAAMVLLMAWSNFHDRLLNCLGATVEEGGPRPPLEVTFAKEAASPRNTLPPSRKREPLSRPDGSGRIDGAREWTALTYDGLQARLEDQRKRSTRVSIPKWEDVERHLPPGLFAKPSLVVWNQVCLGHVPELAIPWEIFMRTSGSETGPKWDRVFGISLFWVTTRAVTCPYCMGHCEMNWEVAGLTKEEIADRSRLLAGDDWSSFPPEQRRTFAFARKLTQTPGDISAADIQVLRKDFGPEGALIVALSASRYHYMTRISNGFQLTLERDNVFYDYWNVTPPRR
jgi:alkylhydroperoxidase family enzyme